MDIQDDTSHHRHLINFPEGMTQEEYNEIVRDRWDGEISPNNKIICTMTEKEFAMYLIKSGFLNDKDIQTCINMGIFDEWPTEIDDRYSKLPIQQDDQ